jgi:hypothetical protein
MSRLTRNFSRSYVGFFTVLFLSFVLIFAGSAESAQNSKNKAKTAPTPKKDAKATPTPKKDARAKATPTPKKDDKKNTKEKTTAAKSSSAKKDDRSSRDNRDKRTTSKNEKTSAKTAKDTKNSSSKDKKENSRTAKTNEKSSSSRNSARNETTKKTPARTASSSSKTGGTRETRSEPARTSGKTTTVKAPTRTVRSEPENIENLPQIIVTDVSARLRNQARANAAEVSRVKLGTVLRVTEKNPAWYRVQYSTGGKTASGWISANAVHDLNAGTREEVYRQIVERNYKPGMDFAAAAELVDFMTSVNGELGKSDVAAELELKRLLLMRDALRKIEPGQSEQSPYREFLKKYEKSVVYSEPAGAWHVASNLFWDLHAKYQKSPIAERIAWEAAQNPLPGECEGYVNCYLFYARMTSGEYLRLHPRGMRASEALRELTNWLEPIAADASQKIVYQGPVDVTDRAEFNNLLAELRTIVSRLALTEKEKTLQQIKQIAEAYR